MGVKHSLHYLYESVSLCFVSLLLLLPNADKSFVWHLLNLPWIGELHFAIRRRKAIKNNNTETNSSTYLNKTCNEIILYFFYPFRFYFRCMCVRVCVLRTNDRFVQKHEWNKVENWRRTFFFYFLFLLCLTGIPSLLSFRSMIITGVFVGFGKYFFL